MRQRIIHSLFFLASVFLWRLFYGGTVFTQESVQMAVVGVATIITCGLNVVSASVLAVTWIVGSGSYPKIQLYMYGIILAYIGIALYRRNKTAAVAAALFVGNMTVNMQTIMYALKDMPIATEVPNTKSSLYQQMSYKVTASKVKCDPDVFLSRLVSLSAKHKIDPGHLLFIMWAESRIDVDIANGKSGAIGLIQFLPSTCKNLGTNAAAVARMDGLEQLELTDKYLTMMRSSVSACHDLYTFYLVFFHPAAVKNADDNYVFSDIVVRSNPGVFETGSYEEFKHYVDMRVLDAGIGI